MTKEPYFKKHTLAWFENRIGQSVNKYAYHYLFGRIFKGTFILNIQNAKPFFLSQKDSNLRYKENV